MGLIHTGDEQAKVILGYYVDDEDSSTGTKMPNVLNISPQAIVPLAAVITYNDITDVTPTGGSNGDVWYNQPADTLHKKVAGVWSELTDKVVNVNYIPPVKNLTDCPL